MGKKDKKLTYHEYSEIVKKQIQSFEKEYKTIPFKENALKTYLKKIEKELKELYSILNDFISIDNPEDQIIVIHSIVDLWKVILNILRQVDQLLLPNIIYQFILFFLTKSEIQPHHLIVNNPLLNEENKQQFYECAQDVKLCIYQTFYTMNTIMNTKQLILYGSMEIQLKSKQSRKRSFSQSKSENSDSFDQNEKKQKNEKDEKIEKMQKLHRSKSEIKSSNLNISVSQQFEKPKSENRSVSPRLLSPRSFTFRRKSPSPSINENSYSSSPTIDKNESINQSEKEEKKKKFGGIKRSSFSFSKKISCDLMIDTNKLSSNTPAKSTTPNLSTQSQQNQNDSSIQSVSLQSKENEDKIEIPTPRKRLSFLTPRKRMNNDKTKGKDENKVNTENESTLVTPRKTSTSRTIELPMKRIKKESSKEKIVNQTVSQNSDISIPNASLNNVSHSSPNETENITPRMKENIQNENETLQSFENDSQQSNSLNDIESETLALGNSINKFLYQENSLFMTSNEKKRLSVLTKILVHGFKEEEMKLNSKDKKKETKFDQNNDLTEKQKKLSNQFGIEIGSEGQFFIENGVSPLFIRFFPEYYTYCFFQIPEFRQDLIQLISDAKTTPIELKLFETHKKRQMIHQMFPRIFGFDTMYKELKKWNRIENDQSIDSQIETSLLVRKDSKNSSESKDSNDSREQSQSTLSPSQSFIVHSSSVSTGTSESGNSSSQVKKDQNLTQREILLITLERERRIVSGIPINESEQEDGKTIEKRYLGMRKKWFDLFLPTTDVFMTFFHYYSRLIYYTFKGEKDFNEFGEIYGMTELLQAYTKQRLEQSSEHSQYLIKENEKKILVMIYPSLLNHFIEKFIHRINLYNFKQIDEFLSVIDTWIVNLIEHNLYSTHTFNMKLFISFIEEIIKTDHFQLLLSTIIMLFGCSYFFIGKQRIQLIKEFLIDKYFFYFFAHWNNYVRRAFHQFILYKLVFSKRSHLNWVKYDKKEEKMYKLQNELGIDGEEIDRDILQIVDEKLSLIQRLSEGEDIKQFNENKIYCLRAFKEFEKEQKMYSEWDRSKKETIPPIHLDIHRVDFEYY